MKRKQFIKLIGFVSLAPGTLLFSCQSEKSHSAAQEHPSYTCPMHPQVIRQAPGNCPICGMELVPLQQNSRQQLLTLDKTQQALANIHTLEVGAGELQGEIAVTGRLQVNPLENQLISSRNAGRIEELYIKESGIPIRQGQPLFRLYSEELLSLQQELLMTQKQARQFMKDPRFQAIFEASREKLRLYGQSSAQIETLLTSGKTAPYTTFYAPASGTVAEVLVSEGQYITEGETVLRLEGYEQLWVEADLYPREASLIKPGQEVSVIINDRYDNPRALKIQFINPSYANGTQLLQVRGTIAHTEESWRPGMPATLLLPEHRQPTELQVPNNAIIRHGKQQLVWLARNEGQFEPRVIETGAESAHQTEVLKGLSQGDRVVVSGAYLLYSEYVLKKGGKFP